MIHLENVKSVTFNAHRWYMRIEVENHDHSTSVYYASSDSSIADSDLWFGSEEEYKEVTSDLH